MITSHSPPNLGDYLKRHVQTFEPALPKRRYARSLWIAKLRWRAIRWYWKERDSVYYFKSLCSLIVSCLQDHDLVLKVQDNVTAPRTCAQMTTAIEVIAKDILGSSPGYLDRYLDRISQSFSSTAWTAGENPTEQVRTHALFFWAMATAVQELPKEDDGMLADNLRSIAASMPCWTTYLECIAQLVLRTRS